jgi:prepilin-type N-terminal cleavage/methylation domain-containing protein
MTAAYSPKRAQDGFTLVEIIISLIVASILGVILVQLMGHSLQKSYRPINQVQESMALTEIVEKMNADYKRRLALSIDPLEDFFSDVTTGNNDGSPPYYGDYTVNTAWIAFDGSGNEITDTAPTGQRRVLKVTVTRGGHAITTLYTK